MAGWNPATPRVRDCGRRGWWGRSREACSYPRLQPPERAGFAPLATCLQNAPTPSACLTRLESKNKRNYDAGEVARGRQDSTFPQLRRPGGTPGPSPALPWRPPMPPGEKTQRHRTLRPRWPPLQASAGACLPRAGGWPLQITEQKARPRGLASGASPQRCPQLRDPLLNL